VIAAIFHRADSASVLRVSNLNPPVHIRQPDAGASLADLSPQIMTDKAVIVYRQSKVVMDSARDRAGLNFRV